MSTKTLVVWAWGFVLVGGAIAFWGPSSWDMLAGALWIVGVVLQFLSIASKVWLKPSPQPARAQQGIAGSV
jgi:hypothetical protein